MDNLTVPIIWGAQVLFHMHSLDVPAVISKLISVKKERKMVKIIKNQELYRVDPMQFKWLMEIFILFLAFAFRHCLNLISNRLSYWSSIYQSNLLLIPFHNIDCFLLIVCRFYYLADCLSFFPIQTFKQKMKKLF